MTRRKVNPNELWHGEARPSVAYNHPDKRECHWCHEQKKRSSGRWVTKTTWICHDCKAKEKEHELSYPLE